MIPAKWNKQNHFKQPAALLVSGLLLSCLSISLMTQPSLAQEGTISGEVKPSVSQSEQEELDWREPLLDEMARLATKLEQEQKLNQLLRDRLDILDHRLDELESQNSALTDKLGALEEAARPGAAAQSRPSEATKGEKPAASAPMELGKNKQQDQMPESGREDHAQAKNPKTQDKPDSKPGKESESGLPDNFEEFLDMGEAMMRRFFGVVKEFRKEFDDNRV